MSNRPLVRPEEAVLLVIDAQLPRGARIVSRSPASLELRFAHRGRKSLRVKADLLDEPAPGYRLAGVEVEPANVWLTGERRVVQRMPDTRVLVLYDREFQPQFEQLRSRLPVHAALAFPVTEEPLREALLGIGRDANIDASTDA